jgi:hypothetical protein
MKFFTTVSTLFVVLGLVYSAHAGVTVDGLKMYVPEACSDACSAMVDQVGGCLEDLDASLSMCIKTSDPASFGTKGDFVGVRDCACSEEAFTASESCFACFSEQACLGDSPLTVDDHRAMCSDAASAAMDLEKRYGLRPCAEGKCNHMHSHGHRQCNGTSEEA